jgi:broad specificity phosphatase PhoE
VTAARVVLLRHGRTGHNHAGVWQGQLDVPLDDVGQAQAAAAALGLGRRIETWQAAGETVRIVSSDLSRAYETARTLAEHAGLAWTTDERLREIYAGAWQGRTRDEIVEASMGAELQAWIDGEDVEVGGGERRSTAGQRVAAALAELAEPMDGGTLVAVTHGGVMRGAALTLMGLSGGDWFLFGGVGNCHTIDLRPGHPRWRMLAYNVNAAE